MTPIKALLALTALATAVGLLASACSSGPATGADRPVVYVFGDIVTMNDAQPTVEAVAVRDGRILATGTRAEVERAAGTDFDLVNLGGKTMLPGFIDPHSHVFFVGAKLELANVSPPPVGPVRNFADMERVLLAFQQQHDIQPGDWILGMGYDDTAMAEGRHPTRDDLDAFAPDRPLAMLHISAHLVTANSLALERAGITADTADPEGGVIRRRPGSREPNGVLEESAILLMIDAVPRPSPEHMERRMKKALAHYAEHGITTAQEGAAKDPAVLELLSRMATRGQLDIDVVAYPLSDIADAAFASNPPSRSYRGNFRVGGVKMILDGSIQGYTAFLSSPYHVPPDRNESASSACLSDEAEELLSGMPGHVAEAAPPGAADAAYRGYPAREQSSVDASLAEAYRNGWHTLVHTNGDAATDQLITAARAARAAVPDHDARTVIIHAQTMREDQLDAAAELGLIPSFFPGHVFYWGDRHRDVFLGPKRAARLDPAKSALDRGMIFTLHHDAPVVPADMLHVVWSAVNRKTATGRPLGPDQRIPALDALKAITIHAAFQYGEEDQKGSIEPGKLADLVILSANPLELEPMAISTIVVEETIKAGRTVYRRR